MFKLIVLTLCSKKMTLFVYYEYVKIYVSVVYPPWGKAWYTTLHLGQEHLETHHKTMAPCMNLYRANQNEDRHASLQQKMAAMCYLQKKLLTLKICINSIKAKQLNVVKTRSKRIVPVWYFVDNDTEHSLRLKLSLYSVIEPVAKDYINSYHQTLLWITECYTLFITW